MENVQQIVSEQGWQFFSCYKCGALISAIELDRALKTNGQGCRCGCMKVQPAQVKVEQYSDRNVVEMAIYLKLDEEDYVTDFLMETELLGWNATEQEEGIKRIRAMFKELLLRCN